MTGKNMRGGGGKLKIIMKSKVHLGVNEFLTGIQIAKKKHL